MIINDQMHRTLELSKTPKRIISLVPSQTELLVDLGLESSLVGITKFCVHPDHLRSTISIVGGTKHVDQEKIKSLKPDIILCNKEENALSMIEDLKHIAPIHISDIYTIDDCLELITMYGELFKVKSKALHINEIIQEKRIDFEIYSGKQPELKVVYFIWRQPWMVVGSRTFIDHVLQLNNFVNVHSNMERYPEVNLLNLSKLNPQVVLLSSEPYPFKEKHAEEIRKHVPEAKIIFVDGEYFSWYGSRLIKAFDYFTTLRQAYVEA